MPKDLIEMIPAHIALTGRSEHEDWVFEGEQGQPPHQNTIGYDWRKARTAAKCLSPSLHDLRHFFASGRIPGWLRCRQGPAGSGTCQGDDHALHRRPSLAHRRRPHQAGSRELMKAVTSQAEKVRSPCSGPWKAEQVLNVRRLLCAGAFREIGDPQAAACDDDHVVVGGTLGYPQWAARDLTSRSLRAGWFPLAVYRRQDLGCVWAFTCRYPVNAIAIHPSGRLAAVGTGAYDGGYAFEGQLHIVDLHSGRRTSVLNDDRSIEHVAWLDERRLEVFTPPATDEEYDWDQPTQARAVLEGNWGQVGERALSLSEGPQEAARSSTTSNTDLVSRLAEEAGHAWAKEEPVWDLALAPVQTVVACRRRVAAEAWSLDKGEIMWRQDTAGTGAQLFMAPDGAHVLSNSAPAWWRQGQDEPQLGELTWFDAETGNQVRQQALPGPQLVVEASDGRRLVRSVGSDRRQVSRFAVLAADGKLGGFYEDTGYDLFNHYLRVRSSPDLLVLVGSEKEPYENKWFGRVEGTRIERLFPLSWLENRRAFGGPGYLLDRGRGKRLLVHGGAFHDWSGLHAGGAFIAARNYANGHVEWQVAVDSQVADLDLDGTQMVGLLNDGTLIGIDAESGTLLWSEILTVEGRAVVTLCMRVSGPGRFLVGTLDGRIVEVTRAEL